MLDTAAINSLKNSGFRINNDSYVKESGELHITVNSTTIIVTNKVTLEADVYEYNEPNLLSVLNKKASKEELTPLDLSIPSEEANSVSSEVKNRALAKMNEEFMSQPITLDDCTHAGFIPYTDTSKRLLLNSFDFRIDMNFNTYNFKVYVAETSCKSLVNPTRKQVDEVYHFFTGEHLDFSPKQKVYSWENCFGGNGWYIYKDCNIHSVTPNQKAIKRSFDIYPTKEDAEAALAHCQLLHIVNKINEDYPKVDKDQEKWFPSWSLDKQEFYHIMNSNPDGGLKLESLEGSKILVRDNKELLKTYFKIK